MAHYFTRNGWRRWIATGLCATLLLGVTTSLALTSTAMAQPPDYSSDTHVRPDVVSAQLAARLQHHRVRVDGLTTESSETYVNPDGSFTTEASAGPARVKRGEGWVPVDTSLSTQGSAVRPAAVPFSLSMSAGNSTALVTSSNNGRHFDLSWLGQLPAPVVDGDTARYVDVAPGEDLTVTATPTGFELSVVFARRPTGPGWGTVRFFV